MIHMDIIFVAIAIPRERIACEGVFAAIAPDFVIIGPAIDEVVAGAGFLIGIARRTIQGISLSSSQWISWQRTGSCTENTPLPHQP